MFFKKKEPSTLDFAIAMRKRAKIRWDGADLAKRTAILRSIEVVEGQPEFGTYVTRSFELLPDGPQWRIAASLESARQGWHRESLPHTAATSAVAPINRSPADALAHDIGSTVADCFSVERFDQFFSRKEMAVGWSRDAGLARWYALGYLCFLTTVAFPGLSEAGAECLLNGGRDGLLTTWKMSPPVFNAFSEFSRQKLPRILDVYRTIDSAQKFLEFFGLFVSEIIGQSNAFSQEGSSTSGPLSHLPEDSQLDNDVALHQAVSAYFATVQQPVREHLERIVVPA